VANRIRPIDEKVEPVRIALQQINVAAAASEAGVPASTLRYDLNKLDQALPEVLANHRPGPKPGQLAADMLAQPPPQEEAGTCAECGGRVRKNGTYSVLNWAMMLIMGCLGLHTVLIQRWRCQVCGHKIISRERARQAEARRARWQQVNRLIAFSRFKLRLSMRATQLLVRFVYTQPVSLGHIERSTQRVGKRAEGALARLSQCRQAVAHFLLPVPPAGLAFDETFPKMKKRTYGLGVGICEYGLIPSLRCVTHKTQDISAQLRRVVDDHFPPNYFLDGPRCAVPSMYASSRTELDPSARHGSPHAPACSLVQRSYPRCHPGCTQGITPEGTEAAASPQTPPAAPTPATTVSFGTQGLLPRLRKRERTDPGKYRLATARPCPHHPNRQCPNARAATATLGLFQYALLVRRSEPATLPNQKDLQSQPC
jgi:hypothetical protein